MTRLTLVGLLLSGLVLLVSVSPASAEKRGVRVDGKDPAEYMAQQTGKAYAVVIGIDSYQKIGSLRYAVADAKAVAQTLRQRGYAVTELYNERATKRAIESELRTKLPRRVGKEDRVLIFYAGHGKDEKIEGGKPMGYLLPVDSERDDIPATGVSMGTVRELADALPAKHVLFLLDVCFGGIAGTLTRGDPPPVTEAYLKQITRERGRHLITAGAADQEVIESAQWGHSVFTYFLLKGLNEGLADQDDNGVITARELHTYLESRVFGEAQQQGHQQTPQMAELSGEKGQFVFFTSAKGKAGTLASPPVASSSPAPAPEPSTALSQAEQELQALQEQERQMEEQEKQAALQRQIEEKKRQLEEKKKKIDLAKAYDLPKQTGREITGRDGAPMVLVPAGEFMMGSNDYDDEKPIHRVSLDDYYIDKYEVTTTRYAAFLQATSRATPSSWNEASQVSDGERPVIGVDWNDADAYCRYYGKRLPTEAEWEKAARGADGRKYPWGNEKPTSRHTNFNKCCDWKGYATLTAVTEHDAGKSPYGAYDMAGNVWEWTADWYDKTYYQSSPDRNPTGPSSGSYKVSRGGSWSLDMNNVRAANRGSFHPTLQGNFLGVRCAKTP
jgi:formylglycine-generating enzyme required for sulfatase activity